MKRRKNAAAEITHTAAKSTTEVRDAIVDNIGPLVHQAQEALAPLAHDAKIKGANFAAKQMEKAQPVINDALDKVTPAVDAARDKVQHDILPKINEALKAAAELPEALPKNRRELRKFQKASKKQAIALAKESKKRGTAVATRLKGEVQPKKKNRAGKVIGTLAVATALLGAVAVLLRRYLNQTDDSGWAAHEPSSAYINRDEETGFSNVTTDRGFVNEAQDKLKQAGEKVADQAQDAGDKIANQAKHAGEFIEDKAADVKDQTKDVVEEVKDSVKAGEPRPFSDAVDAPGGGRINDGGFGDGAYVGENPPEGYVIKGNGRSKKYHMVGNLGFERTIADVWFNSEAAAQKAGFIKAQR